MLLPSLNKVFTYLLTYLLTTRRQHLDLYLSQQDLQKFENRPKNNVFMAKMFFNRDFALEGEIIHVKIFVLCNSFDFNTTI